MISFDEANFQVLMAHSGRTEMILYGKADVLIRPSDLSLTELVDPSLGPVTFHLQVRQNAQQPWMTRGSITVQKKTVPMSDEVIASEIAGIS